MRVAQTVLLGLLLGLTSRASSAATDIHTKPRHVAPARTAHSAPDVTGTIAKPAAPPPSDDAIPPPFKLPSASRARVRACGLAWRDMKIAGKTGDDDWRDFAEKCLVAKETPNAYP